MPSVIDENTQFIDESTGEPINNGYIYIGTQNLDAKLNPITIYSDRALTTVLGNPQRTGPDGRSVNKIWIPGKYSMKVEDSDNVQKLNDLDLGESVQVGNSILNNASGVNDVVATGSPTITTLVDRQTYIFLASATNTGAMTLTIDGTATLSIKKNHDVPMSESDIESGQVVVVVYNGTDAVFEIISNLITDPASFDNYAALKLAPTSGGLSFVLGYATPGDGGAGEFWWNSSSTESDDDGTIIQSTGTPTGRWKRNYIPSMINAAWFGAISTASAAANTIKIQAAIDVNATGVVFIPRGVLYTYGGLTGVGGATASLMDYSRTGDDAAGLFIRPHLSVEGDIDIIAQGSNNPELTFKNAVGYGAGIDDAIISTNPTTDTFQIKIPDATDVARDVFLSDTHTNTPDPRFKTQLAIDHATGNPSFYLRENTSNRVLLDYSTSGNQAQINVRNAADSAWLAALKITGETNTPVAEVFNLNISSIPLYADEVAAVAGGLATGDLYKTATGEVRVKL